MTLNEQSAKEILKNPASKKKIEAVKFQESQLRVFTEDMSLKELESEAYWKELMKQMTFRSAKKFTRVKEFFRYPLPVVQTTDSILNDFFKVYDGKNRFFKVNGDRDVTKLEEWILKNKPELWIEQTGKKVFKNKPNSFVVVDVDDNNDPYLIDVDSERLVDAKFKDSEGNLEYIAFVHSQKEEMVGGQKVITTFFSVYDDTTYYVFSKESNSDVIVQVSNREHGIGYCPGKSFIHTPSNSKNNFKRRVAFTTALSRLEDFTMFDVFRNYVDYYVPFPVTEAPKNKCQNSECENGKVPTEVLGDKPADNKTIWNVCPTCKGSDGSELIFPGTHIGIKVQADKDANDGSGVFKMIFPDVAQMKYIPKKLEDLEIEIKYKTVGVNTLTTSEAFNELQVKGSFASMETILMRTKTELDVLYKWIAETVGRIYYKDLKVTIDANFGSEFYLVSEDDLQKRYENAKKIGLPMEELMAIYIQLIETKYKGNSEKINRQKMILQLDPLPLVSNIEAMEMKEKNIIDASDLSMKLNFLNFITKFENENVPVTQFGLNLELWQRIEQIKKTLNIYNNETIKSKQLPKSVEGV